MDIELEVYKSGNEINMTLSWISLLNTPILWQGKHSVWMDSDSGAKCQDNPWGEGADTLEWKTSSPPPFHTFEDLPEIK